MMVVLIGIIVLQGGAGVLRLLRELRPPLPLSTRIIVACLERGRSPTSGFIVVGVIGLAVAAIAWARQPAQRHRLDRWLLDLPWAGETARKFSTSQLARTLATLLGGGIPLVNALEISVRSLSNRYLAR